MRLVLAGDVMTGRGVDQVLPSPGAPDLHEDLVRDARTYVDLAERVAAPSRSPWMSLGHGATCFLRWTSSAQRCG